MFTVHAKAIPFLDRSREPETQWQDGPLLTAEAYGRGRPPTRSSGWKKRPLTTRGQHPTLAEFYERDRRWKQAADAYARAREPAAQISDLKTRASALLNAGGRENIATARRAPELVSAQPNDRALYLLAQVERRSGDLRLREQTRAARSPRIRGACGDTRRWPKRLEETSAAGFDDALESPSPEFRARSTGDSFPAAVLPHLAWAHSSAIMLGPRGVRERTSSPKDPIASYLIETNIAAKKFTAAAEPRTRTRRTADDCGPRR